MELKTDILIIGSGIAGLYAAIRCSEFSNVILVTKKEKNESNTNYAQGGIASVLDKQDSFEKHIADTLIAGAGLCNPKMVEILVKEGPEKINKLIEIGVNFTQKDGCLDLAREGGHSHSRIVHAKDLTGKEVERALVNQAISIKNINILENTLAIDLITEHNIRGLKNSPIESRRCYGAYVLDILSNKVLKILAKATLLATGGMGQVYLHTTNPQIATGDGFAMAYRAGAKVANMEFVQFHPTALFESNYKFSGRQSFLISEAVRGFGGILRNSKGETFMNKYDNRLELAPRDIVARAIDSELKKSGDESVFLDITHKPESEIKDKFPNIYKYCLSIGIDIAKHYIPVVPAAHYACGGVITDENAKTTLIGLFATGEVAMTGVHGANRLASNSLLEALVFSDRAAEYLKRELANSELDNIFIPEWDETGVLSAEEKILISHSSKELKQLMSDYVGIVRSNLRLEYASRRVKTLYDEIESFYKKTKIFPDLIELRNLITCAHLIIKSSLQRKESRGLFYSIDYIEKLPDKYTRDTILQNTYQIS